MNKKTCFSSDSRLGFKSLPCIYGNIHDNIIDFELGVLIKIQQYKNNQSRASLHGQMIYLKYSLDSEDYF